MAGQVSRARRRSAQRGAGARLLLHVEAAGIDVPRTRLLGKTRRNVGYFAIERFDRQGTKRIHSHTLGGLLQLPSVYTSLDYGDLLKLTRNEAAVSEMFRRACFNVFAHNRDDHSRNFAFVMDEQGTWRPSPAYDLTFASGFGGEHKTLVAGDARAPGREHLAALAERVELRHSARVIDEVRAAVDRFALHADQAGVPAKLRDRIAGVLGASKHSPGPGRRSGRGLDPGHTEQADVLPDSYRRCPSLLRSSLR
jgi:serine/threonine-protein kinase HipA